MIARVGFLMPYDILLAVGDEFEPIQLRDGGYDVVVYAPMCGAALPSSPVVCYQYLPELVASVEAAFPEPRPIKLGAHEYRLCNYLRLDFRGDDFVRGPIEVHGRFDTDPPRKIIFSVINRYLEVLRTVLRDGQIRRIDPTTALWRIDYLNDDGSPLLATNDLYTRSNHPGLRLPVSFLRSASWSVAESLLSEEQTAPVWDTLALDAVSRLPEAGPAAVAMITAIEAVVDAASEHWVDHDEIDGRSKRLWEWIRERRHPLQPSFRDRIKLLGYVAGRPLNKNEKLWGTFNELYTLRNNYVHEGRETIGENSSPQISLKHVTRLIREGLVIVRWIEQYLPEERRIPVPHDPALPDPVELNIVHPRDGRGHPQISTR